MNNTHCFKIDNFHAVGHAEILLNGITVLAGINGCGKSTIARSVYSLVNSINEYDKIQQERFYRILAGEIERGERILYSFGPLLSRARYQYNNLLNSDVDFEEATQKLFFYHVERLGHKIRDRASSEVSDIFLERAYRHLLDDETKVKNVEDLLTLYKERCNVFYFQQLESFHKKIQEKNIDNLDTIITTEYPDCESIVKISSFTENEIELLNDNSFLPTLTLDRAIYIDTPMVFNMDRTDRKTVWGHFLSLLSEKNNDVLQDEEKMYRIQLVLRTVIGGNIVEVTDLGRKVLHYKSNDGIDIDIKQTATGIKSFAYILRLLDNGWLNSQSLLIIDEPEAHLHPQWVVEFAKILVLLQKDLGVKILVASHNPDMVAAIHDMSDYYKLSDKTNFYIAKENEVGRYDYHYLGSEIGDIFETFNVALEMIRAYGRED